MKGLVALCCAAYAAALSAPASKPMPPARAEPPPTKETYEFSYSGASERRDGPGR